MESYGGLLIGQYRESMIEFHNCRLLTESLGQFPNKPPVGLRRAANNARHPGALFHCLENS
jgi:hypothetical protein